MAKDYGVSISSDVSETIIGPKTRFKGTVNTDKPIRIEGLYEGTIESSSTVTVAESGTFDGTCNCKCFELQGKANGKVNCSDVLKFAVTGKFTGDAVTANVDIHPGSDFDGTLKIQKNQ